MKQGLSHEELVFLCDLLSICNENDGLSDDEMVTKLAEIDRIDQIIDWTHNT